MRIRTKVSRLRQRLREIGNLAKQGLLKRDLYPYQEEVLEWARERDAVGLFLEMRLGKTLLAIRWAQERGCRLVLVVCPASVAPVWQEELRKEQQEATILETLSVEEVLGWSLSGWAIVSYARLRRMPDLAYAGWDAVLLDESTKIKNPKAQITKLLNNRFEDVRCRAILSGLPAPEGLLDYFEQLRFLLGGEFMGCRNYWDYRERYFMREGFSWSPKLTLFKPLTRALNEHCFTLSRKQAGIGETKIKEPRYLPMIPQQEKEHRQVLRDFEWEAEDKVTQWSLAAFHWLLRIAGGVGRGGRIISPRKLAELVSLVTGELKSEPVVVWFCYNAELRAAHRKLKAANVKGITWITGKLTPKERAKRIGLFQLGKRRVMLAQVKCAKYGQNLSRSSTAIRFSRPLSLETFAQSEDRIVHPAKEEPLLYVDLITKGSFDEEVYNLLREKAISSKALLAAAAKLKERSL